MQISGRGTSRRSRVVVVVGVGAGSPKVGPSRDAGEPGSEGVLGLERALGVEEAATREQRERRRGRRGRGRCIVVGGCCVLCDVRGAGTGWARKSGERRSGREKMESDERRS